MEFPLVQGPPHESDMVPVQHMIFVPYQYAYVFHSYSCCSDLGLGPCCHDCTVDSVFLSLRWLLIVVLWLIMTWRLLILSSGHIRIQIIRHVSHRKLILGVDTCHHSTCLPFFIFCKAPIRLLIYILLSGGTCDLPRFQPILNTFTNSYHICEISRGTADHFLKIQPLKRTHEDVD